MFTPKELALRAAKALDDRKGLKSACCRLRTSRPLLTIF